MNEIIDEHIRDDLVPAYRVKGGDKEVDIVLMLTKHKFEDEIKTA